MRATLIEENGRVREVEIVVTRRRVVPKGAMQETVVDEKTKKVSLVPKKVTTHEFIVVR